MKKQYIIANWKSHKTLDETKEWFSEFSVHSSEITDRKDVVAVVCPPFPLLPACKELVETHHLPLFVGSQDISQFQEGAYTGFVSGRLLKELVMYTIIGHSESRQYFHESLEDLQAKVAMALSVGIAPVYCVSDKNEKIPTGVQIVAFEPISAIGSGKPDDPQEVEATAAFIKQQNSVTYVLYGGSVTGENVSHYTSLTSIDGVLIGGASLSADVFANIIQHA
jgi:triosephosphate isomerase